MQNQREYKLLYTLEKPLYEYMIAVWLEKHTLHFNIMVTEGDKGLKAQNL